MTEPTTISTPLSEAPDGTPPATASPPARPPKRWDWKPKLRWFAAEIVVVVAGVLIALALNAWWGARADHAKEQTYLRQLVSDLEATERTLTLADSVEWRFGRATAKLQHAFYALERPPRDSLIAWIDEASWIRPTRPILGTAEALVATGDLGLIRDDSLRSAITAYLDDMRRLAAIHDDNTSVWFEHQRDLYRSVDRTAVAYWRYPPEDRDSLARVDPLWAYPLGPHRTPIPMTPDGFLNDRDAYAAVVGTLDMKRNLRSLRRLMREQVMDLRQQIEAELNR
jgi:hypothetical protein